MFVGGRAFAEEGAATATEAVGGCGAFEGGRADERARGWWQWQCVQEPVRTAQLGMVLGEVTQHTRHDGEGQAEVWRERAG